MFALLLLLLPSFCQSLPHSQELKNCDSSGPRVSALSLNSALSTFLCYTEKELAAMEEEQKKRKLALKIAPSIRHAESGSFEKLVEVLTDMKEEDLVKIVNVVVNNESNEGERKTLPEYIQVIEELIGETGVESELAKNLHLVSLLKSDLEDQGRGGRGAFGNLVLSILGLPPLFPDGKDDQSTSTTPKPTTVALGSTAASMTTASSTGGSTAVTTTAASSTGGSTAVTTTATSSTGGSTASSSTGGSTAASTTVGSTATSTTASTAASTSGASTAASTTGASTAASTTGASTASSTAAASTTTVSTAASTTAVLTTVASTATSTTVASTTGATTASTTGASTAASTTVASTTVVSTAASTTGASTATSTTAASTTVASTAASTTGASMAASTTVSTTAASTAASTTVASTVATTTAAPPTCPGNSDEVSAVDCICGVNTANICTGGTQGCETAVSICRDVCSTVDAPITGNDPCFCKLQGSSAADLCAVGQTCSSTTGLCT